MQMGFYFDQTRCTGCYACIVACKDWHDVPPGPASWRRVIALEYGKFPDLFVAFLTTACYHCAHPACLEVCPAGAITKREQDGIVVVDEDACTACEICRDACPYAAPQFGAEADARMQKCNLCLERIAEGNKPVCVEGCPMRALDAGPLEELQAKYGNTSEAEGFIYDKELSPSVVFKPRKNVKNLALKNKIVSPIST